MDLSQVKDTFLQEARDLLLQFETLLLKAEIQDLDNEELNALFRCAHTIKGSAGLFGFGAIVKLTHIVENMLDALRKGSVQLSPELADILLRSRDGISNLVDDAELAEHAAQDLGPEDLALLDELETHLRNNATEQDAKKASTANIRTPLDNTDTPTEQTQDWHIHARFGSEVLRNGIDPISCLRYLANLGNITNMSTEFVDLPSLEMMDPEQCYLAFDFNFECKSSLADIDSTFEFAREGSDITILPLAQTKAYKPRKSEIIAEHPLSVESTNAAGLQEHLTSKDLAEKSRHAGKTNERKFLKVEASKLDRLIDLVGELVIAGASANILANQKSDPQMIETVSIISSLVEQIRDGALNMRMVPMGEIFQRFPRVVRDVSQELGKEIELNISGEETELDKSMVEKLADPLMHIVRNSLDHGIESAETRLATGKPARGLIELNAYHESGSVVIEVSDDGGGIHREKVLRKAIERGLVEADAALSDEQVYQLLFEPGFSTAETITNLSGRGVGMDVVRRNIEALRGEIEVESEPAEGTTIRLRVPLTLAIIDGFQVCVGKAQFVIPLDMVIECIELMEERHTQQRFIELRGEILPYIDIRSLFEITEAAPTYRYIIVVQYGNKRAGLVVDSLIGALQVVIKPLGTLFRNAHGLSGSAILGSGEVALILDVPQLVQIASLREQNLIAQNSRHVNYAQASGPRQ